MTHTPAKMEASLMSWLTTRTAVSEGLSHCISRAKSSTHASVTPTAARRPRKRRGARLRRDRLRAGRAAAGVA